MTPKDVKALQPIPTASFKCPVCKHLYLNVEAAAICTKRCGADAYRKDLAARKEEKREKNMHWVRENAISLPHAMELLVSYTKTLGITLSFSQYPKYMGDVSNSHGAPLGGFPRVWSSYDNKENFPGKYPGFEGRWEGTIRGKCPYSSCFDYRREITFHCLVEHIVSGFHSGSGCPGKDFSIGGYLFLYDFPKMMLPGNFMKTLFHVYPNIKNLEAIELAHTLSPKLIEAASKPKSKNGLELKSYLYAVKEHW